MKADFRPSPVSAAALAAVLACAAGATAQSITGVSASAVELSDRFVVTGVGFGSIQGQGQLLVGGVPAHVTSWSDGKIRAHVAAATPPGPAGVQVIAAGSSNTVPITVMPRQGGSGRVRWRLKTDHLYSFARPAIAPDGTIYHTGVPGPMYSISPSGHVNWVLQGAGGVRPAAVGPDGTVYVAGGGGSVTARTPAGQLLWAYNAPSNAGPMFVGPSVGPDGKIYAVTEEEPSLGTNFGAFALHPDGSLAWNTSGGYNFRASPQGWEVAFSAGRLYFATGQGGPTTGNPGIHALDAGSGQEAWVRPGISKLQADGAGNLYWLGAINNNYIGSYTAAGDERWTIVYNTFWGQPGGYAVAPGGDSFYGTSTGARHAAIRPDGSVRWQASPGYTVRPYGALPDGSGFLAVAYLYNPTSFRMRLYSAADGSVLWEEVLPFEEEVHMGPNWEGAFSPDGRTFYISLTGNNYSADPYCYLYAFDVGGSCYANCDGSTAPPTLNVSDFICFQSRFAAGCP